MRTKYPVNGDVRTRTFFAWIPFYALGYRWWLERVTATEQYWNSGHPNFNWEVVSVNGQVGTRSPGEI